LQHFADKVKAGADGAITQYFYDADAYFMVFSEFAERLDMLEQQCHSQDKKALHNLQGWVKSP
jgi:hypothetical protein